MPAILAFLCFAAFKDGNKEQVSHTELPPIEDRPVTWIPVIPRPAFESLEYKSWEPLGLDLWPSLYFNHLLQARTWNLWKAIALEGTGQEGQGWKKKKKKPHLTRDGVMWPAQFQALLFFKKAFLIMIEYILGHCKIIKQPILLKLWNMPAQRSLEILRVSLVWLLSEWNTTFLLF